MFLGPMSIRWTTARMSSRLVAQSAFFSCGGRCPDSSAILVLRPQGGHQVVALVDALSLNLQDQATT